MELPKGFVGGGALLALALVFIVGYLILQPPSDLLVSASFSEDTISPNADGENDIAVFSYELSAPAEITLRFENEETDETFFFRNGNDQVSGSYSVNFSGVVDGYTRVDETLFDNNIDRRLIPNGNYEWTFIAEGEDETQQETGTLTVEGADTNLPLIESFEVSSQVFTPNQDGIRDRIQINLFLAKEAELNVYLEDNDGSRIFIAERLGGREPGDTGSHEFDYDGGVDDGYEPPADGDYTLFAVAQDDEGQRVIRQTEITIQDGGMPQMEIVSQASGATVCFYRLEWDDRYYTTDELQGDVLELPEGSCSDISTITLEQGDLLVFKLAVRNYGRTPVRTIGPFPGVVYEYDQQTNTLGYLEKDGAFRVGINCQTTLIDFPWRWAVGTQEALTAAYDEELNETFYYLEPAAEGEDPEAISVWGAIRMTTILEERNPQNCYAGLIHEGVAIDPFQRTVGIRSIEILPVEGFENEDVEAGAWTPTPFGG